MTKKCISCKNIFPRNKKYFYFKKEGWPSSMCIECHNKETSKYRKNNPESAALFAARSRCNNINDAAFSYYGARGIKCLIKNTKELIRLIGKRPHGMSLDRIDNNGNYEHGNIRWTTRLEQNRNRSLVKFNKEKVKKLRNLRSKGFTYDQLAEIFGCSRQNASYIARGMTWAII